MPDIRIVPGNAIMSFTSSLNYIERITQDPSGSLTLYGSGSTGRTELFSIDGNNGRLFSVSDDLSDSLFSVNTIAGLPVIEAFADNRVNIGQYGVEAIKVSGSRAFITGSLFGTASYATFAQTPTVAGATGAVGVTGATGPIGVSGATGVVGVSGATGVVGVSGATGVIGVSGATGVIGVSGATGVIGVSGATGVIGVSGATGVVGVSGATGVVGVSGATGPVGVSGATGVVGVSGATGLTGATGATLSVLDNTNNNVLTATGTSNVQGESTLTYDGSTLSIVSGKALISTDGTYGTGYGSIGFGGLTNGSNRIFGSAGASDGLYLASATGRGIFFRANGGATDHMIVSSSGNVGIGTTSPSFPLSFGTGLGNKIALYDAGSGNGYGFGIQTSLLQIFSNASGDDITFGYGNSASLTRNVTFKGTGNVGIGTTSPSEKLEVNGYILSDRYYPKSSNSTYLIGDSGGLVLQGTGYFYSNASGGSYFQSTVRFRGQVINDTGAYLHLGGGTAGHTYSQGNLGIRTTAPGVGFVNVTATPSAGPTLGSGTVGSQALLASNALYGMYSGVSNSGDVWHQVQRNDTNGAVYGLLLQPNGGGVAIAKGTTSPAHALDVSGTGNATSDFRAPIFYDTNDTSYYVDPHSTSRLFSLNVVQTVNGGIGGSGTPTFSFTGDTNTGMFNPSGTDTLGFSTAGTERLRISPAGAMGLGITPTNTSGRFEATNDIVAYSTSDKRWKNNIVNINSPLEKISQINGVEFDWIEDEPFHGNKGHDVGVIAQEVELVIPEAVQTRESGMKAVQYDKIIPLLIEAIKELEKQIKELKNKK